MKVIVWHDLPDGTGQVGPQGKILEERAKGAGVLPGLMVPEQHLYAEGGEVDEDLVHRWAKRCAERMPSWWPDRVLVSIDDETRMYEQAYSPNRTAASLAAEAWRLFTVRAVVETAFGIALAPRRVAVGVYGRPWTHAAFTRGAVNHGTSMAGVVGAAFLNPTAYQRPDEDPAAYAARIDDLATVAVGALDVIDPADNPHRVIVNWSPVAAWTTPEQGVFRMAVPPIRDQSGAIRIHRRYLPEGADLGLWMAPRWQSTTSEKGWLNNGWPDTPEHSQTLENAILDHLLAALA